MRFCGPAPVSVRGWNSATLRTEATYTPLKWIEYGVYRDLIIIRPKPYSIYLRATINPKP